MKLARINSMEAIAGIAVIGLGLFGLVTAWNYSLGTLRVMGPGYLPVAYSILLMLSGLGIILVEGTDPQAQQISRPAWRGLALVIAAICAFALLVDRHGLFPASLATVLISAMADGRYHPLKLLVFAVSISAVATAIFVWGLGLPVEPFKW